METSYKIKSFKHKFIIEDGVSGVITADHAMIWRLDYEDIGKDKFRVISIQDDKASLYNPSHNVYKLASFPHNYLNDDTPLNNLEENASVGLKALPRNIIIKGR